MKKATRLTVILGALVLGGAWLLCVAKSDTSAIPDSVGNSHQIRKRSESPRPFIDQILDAFFAKGDRSKKAVVDAELRRRLAEHPVSITGVTRMGGEWYGLSEKQIQEVNELTVISHTKVREEILSKLTEATDADGHKTLLYVADPEFSERLTAEYSRQLSQIAPPDFVEAALNSLRSDMHFLGMGGTSITFSFPPERAGRQVTLNGESYFVPSPEEVIDFHDANGVSLGGMSGPRDFIRQNLMLDIEAP